MNLLGTLGSLAMGAMGKSGSGPLLMAAFEQVRQFPGGLAGLVDAFQRGGLGEVLNSWIATGPNLPITGEQVQSVFGAERIDAIASTAGVEQASVLDTLVKLLPQVVDGLSPNGTLDTQQKLDPMALLAILGRGKG